MSKMTPFKFQRECLNEIEWFNGRVLVALDCGLGKTALSLWHLLKHPEKLPAVVVCPATVKFVWSREAEKVLFNRISVAEGRTPPEEIGKLAPEILVLNYDILQWWVKWLRKLKPKTVILDECFLWDTTVLTDCGRLPIGLIVDYELPVKVASWNSVLYTIDYKPILHYSRKQRAKRIAKIVHENGTITCTENHKVWIEGRGYVEAKSVVGGEILRVVRKNKSGVQELSNSFLQQKLCFSIQQSSSSCCCFEEESATEKMLRGMWSRICGDLEVSKILQQEMLNSPHLQSKNVARNTNRRDKEEIATIYAKFLRDSSRSVSEGKKFCSYDRQQSNEGSIFCAENGRSKRNNWDIAYMERRARREWNLYRATEEIIRSTGESGLGLGIGIVDSNWQEMVGGRRVSNELQSRHRTSNFQSSNRNRWVSTSQSKSCGEGSKEDESFDFSRVESVEIYEPRDQLESKRNSYYDFVYNIEVEENHNYFADGVLVSNCQALVNPNAKRTRAMKKLVKGVPNVFALSGTPLLNRPMELFPTLSVLRPDVFESRWSFGHQFCEANFTPYGWQYKGATNTEELNKLLLKTCMIRRRKIDVLKDLPEKIRQVVPMDLSDKNEYRKANLDFAAWLHKKDPAKAMTSLKAETLTKMGYLLRLAAELKLPSVLEWINEWLLESDEKLIVFAEHQTIIKALKEKCNAKSVVIDGSVIKNDRTMAVDIFQRDPKTRLLIGSKAASTGITLTAASTVAFAELWWRPGDHLQAEDRPHRIGQTETVLAHYFVARGTIEEKLCRILQEKQEVISSVMDGGPQVTDISIYQQLLREMAAENGDPIISSTENSDPPEWA